MAPQRVINARPQMFNHVPEQNLPVKVDIFILPAVITALHALKMQRARMAKILIAKSGITNPTHWPARNARMIPKQNNMVPPVPQAQHQKINAMYRLIFLFLTQPVFGRILKIANIQGKKSPNGDFYSLKIFQAHLIYTGQ